MESNNTYVTKKLDTKILTSLINLAQRAQFIIDELEKMPGEKFVAPNILKTFQEMVKKQKISIGEFYNTSRYLITGMAIGGPVPTTMEVLGKDKVMNRLRKYKDFS